MKKAEILKKVERHHKLIVALFLVLFFLVGTGIFSDYGLSYDETRNRNYGIETFEFVFEGKIPGDRLALHRQTHGPAFEFTLILVEKGLELEDTRDIFLMRHILTFLLFCIAMGFFYLLCKHIFQSWKIGLLAIVFLAITPRIFAHTFFNSVDIAFLSLFVISAYTMVRYLDKKTWRNAFFHAVACALVIDIRVIGAIVPVFTILFVAAELAKQRANKKMIRKIGTSLTFYIALLIPLTIILWPFLWKDPIGNFVSAVLETSRDPLSWLVFYFGEHIESSEIPWHFTPVWILISTPLLYIGLFIAGLFASVKCLLARSTKCILSKRNTLIILLWFFLPLTAAAVLKPTLWDTWRHFFFIYPAFLIIAVRGLLYLFRFAKEKFAGQKRNLAFMALILIVAIGLIEPLYFMINNHPYQHVYFNVLAGKDMQEIKNQFDLEYFGTSYKQGLEYILENDKREIIRITSENWPGLQNLKIIPREDRERLRWEELSCSGKVNKNLDYFLSNYRWHEQEYPYDEYYSINVGGAKILGVYKLK